MSIYRIGSIDFDPGASEIGANGEITHLQPQVSSVLECLARHPGAVVSRETLIEEAWAGRHTSDESITRCISLLRQQFEQAGDRNLIETIPKKGYRLIGPVELQAAPPNSKRQALPRPEADNQAKMAVNLVITVAVGILLLSCLLIAADFFTLRK